MLKESGSEPWTILRRGWRPCADGGGSKGCEALAVSPERDVSLPPLRVSHAVVVRANSGNNCVFCAVKPSHARENCHEVGLMLPMKGAGISDHPDRLTESCLVLLRGCLSAFLEKWGLSEKIVWKIYREIQAFHSLCPIENGSFPVSLVNDPFLNVQLDAREFGTSFCVALKAMKTWKIPFLVARELAV